MQVDKTPFPVHTIDLNNAKVLTHPEQAEGAKGKNVIIGEERPKLQKIRFRPGKWCLRRLLMGRSL
jgi:hypothetical protein